jgi:GNAT superfamily N-acetyltransferase
MVAEDFDAFVAYATAYAALAAAMPEYRVVPIGRGGSIVCVTTPFPVTSANRAMAVRLREDEVAGAIDGVLSAWDAAAVPGSWWLDPGTTPPGIERALERRGFSAADSAPVMSIDLDDLPELEETPGAELSFVHDRDTMRLAQLVAATSFGRPAAIAQQMADVIAPLGEVPDSPVRVVVARIDGVIVGAATTAVAGELSGLFNVATLPEARGRGLGRVTTLAVLHDARERGARVATLHASQLGYGIYLRMGFRHDGDFRRFTKG